MLGDLEKAVRLAVRAGADSAEAFGMWSTGTSFSVEKDSVSNAHAASHEASAIRVIKGGRLGFAYYTGIDEARSAVGRALKISRLSARTEYRFPGEKKAAAVLKPDPRILAFTAEMGVEGLVTLTRAALDVDPHLVVAGAGVGWGTDGCALVNSEGARFREVATSIHASAYTVYKNGGSATGFDFDSKMRGRIDWAKVGRNAGGLAVRAARPRRLGKAPKEVIFTPFASETLFEFLLVKALHADVVDKGQSVYSGRIGDTVASSALTLVDDPLDPAMPNSASHDDEGVRSKRNVLIEKGRLTGVLADLESASRRETPALGSSLRYERRDAERSVKAPPTTCGRNIVLRARNVKFGALVSSTKDGVLVYDLLGAHTANPQSGDFSVTAATLFRIKDGEILHAVKPVVISGNLPDLMKRVTGVADDYRDMSGSFSPVNLHVPSVRFEGVNVAGR
ncbi:MAG: TldD/PmbA family protein [Euryarchaeota archaeon]|nr:TldD/PmbA family protein [Euryarchaeota archaeon]